MLENYRHYCWFKDCFSENEISQILTSVHDVKAHAAEVGDGEGNSQYMKNRRLAAIRTLYNTPLSQWVYERIAQVAVTANNKYYQFQLDGTISPIQIIDYNTGGRYNWHLDFGNKSPSTRKLTVVIQLSPSSQYQGGHLELLTGDKAAIAPLDMGTAIIFPSFITHRVTELTQGFRQALVCWLHGTPFS